MMLVLSFARAQRSYLLATILLGFVCVVDQALATSCQVYPSEYAYRDNSVSRQENASANCRSYPAGTLPGNINQENYIHCDGTQLELADSNLGQEQYSSFDYYVWPAGRVEQLLFIFPTRVSLTTITLHYYSDSDRGLPRLRFYAVPDDFDVWDAPTIGIPREDVAAVPPGGGPAGRRNVSINVNFNTRKVLMYKYSSTYPFAVSEVDLLICNAPSTTTELITTSRYTTVVSSTTPATTYHVKVTTTEYPEDKPGTSAMTRPTIPQLLLTTTGAAIGIHLQSVHWLWIVILVMKLLM